MKDTDLEKIFDELKKIQSQFPKIVAPDFSMFKITQPQLGNPDGLREYLKDRRTKKKNVEQLPRSIDYIKPELHARLEEIEAKMIKKIVDWCGHRKKGYKIECATFCALLSDKKFFIEPGEDPLIDFARLRYHIDIELQIKRKKKEIQNHKKLSNHFFK